MLQVLEITANYLVKLRWVPVLSVFPCHQFFLTSAGDCSQFSTPFAPGNLYPEDTVCIQKMPDQMQLVWHLPQSAVASTFPSSASSPWTHSDSPQLPHCVERPWQSWKYFKRLSSCGTSSPAVLCVKEGFASLLPGVTESTKAQPHGLLGSSQSFQRAAECLENTSFISVG